MRRGINSWLPTVVRPEVQGSRGLATRWGGGLRVRGAEGRRWTAPSPAPPSGDLLCSGPASPGPNPHIVRIRRRDSRRVAHSCEDCMAAAYSRFFFLDVFPILVSFIRSIFPIGYFFFFFFLFFLSPAASTSPPPVHLGMSAHTCSLRKLRALRNAAWASAQRAHALHSRVLLPCCLLRGRPPSSHASCTLHA